MTEVGDEFFYCPNLEVKWFRGGVVAILLVDEVCDWMFECWGQGWYCAVAVVVVVVTVLGNFWIEIKIRLFLWELSCWVIVMMIEEMFLLAE